ncbi:hypothetical protein CJP74_03185 [Psittacicella melopsittaci]|uniref:Uncharacterized protein n=1 Tax=Psittacicella melopsittaci TaxID=2028576 RepID=A0A3A1Y6U6_9GAMM|nr:TolC family protein [Psittacicella melopsittaci]RIY32999.1 hypothetical protein CJP74_03185 [Psittacicella melopsittaci]
MKLFTSSALVVIALTLAACSTNVSQTSSVQLPDKFTNVQTAGADQNRQNLESWWLNWNDPVLTNLIEQGLKNNLDLASAQAKLEQALAQSNLSKADLGPSLGVVGQGSVSRSKVETEPNVFELPYSNRSMLVGGINASWEVDIFGKKRSDADAAYHTALASQDQFYGTQLLITAQIAQTYFQLIAVTQQIQVLNAQLEQLQKLEAYVAGRYNAGQTYYSDLLQVKQQVASLKASLATFPAQRDSLVRQLAILTGNVPEKFTLVVNPDYAFNLPAIPGAQPSDLLNRRPDLRANAQLVEAAAAKVASAKADYYPRFTLNFLGMGGRIELSDGLDYASGASGILGLNIQLPIFTNGRIKANVVASNAALRQAMINYDKNLLQALADVENAYQLQYSLGEQRSHYEQAFAYATSQDQQFYELYKYGDKTLGDAINATLDKYKVQLNLINSKYQAAVNMLSLYKALGGGWSANN